MAHYNSGWDHFTPNAGVIEEAFCRVCKEKMKVNRNVEGPRTYFESMSKNSSSYDEFYCEHYDKPWHIQVYHLMKQIQDCPSASLIKIYELEIEDIIKNKKSTLPKYEEKKKYKR